MGVKYRRGIAVGVTGVARRDAIVHQKKKFGAGPFSAVPLWASNDKLGNQEQRKGGY